MLSRTECPRRPRGRLLDSGIVTHALREANFIEHTILDRPASSSMGCGRPCNALVRCSKSQTAITRNRIDPETEVAKPFETLAPPSSSRHERLNLLGVKLDCT